MILSDFHTHTKYSFDSASEPEDVISRALECGLSSIALTDHYDVDYIDTGINAEIDLEGRKKEIAALKEKYKGKISIYHGIELGQPYNYPELAEKAVRENDFEFILGSVHNLKNVPDFYFINFAKAKNHEGMIVNLYNRYIDDITKLTELSYVDSVGHITYPLRYIKEGGIDHEIERYYEKYEHFFKKLISAGKVIEINTSNIRKGYGFTMPDSDLLKMYKELGGKYVTVGSDGHRVPDIAMDITAGYEKAESAGLKVITDPKQIRNR